jgi:hypothetical protein
MHVKYIDIERMNTPENSSMFDHPTDEIVIEEKVDGGNGCFWLEDGKLHVASRSRDLTQENDVKTFSNQRKWLEEQLMKYYENINPNFRYYCEWMQKHTLNYGKDIPPVIGLEIMPIEGAFGKKPYYLGRRAKEDAFNKLGIPCVHLHGIYTVKDLNDELYKTLTEKSAYYDGKPEGIVLKNYMRQNVWGRQMFAKIVLDEFKETNRAVFGGIKKDTSDTLKICDVYCTEARIRKRILNLMHEGSLPLSRSLMKYLPIAVCQDIFKEETNEIIKNYKDISLGTLKQVVAKKCLTQIDAMMVEAMDEPGFDKETLDYKKGSP